ncbi:MAG: phosphoglucosamine mutase [Phycisphaerae bacterium]|nr:phosphoglucosamine mutase [Phycisphaerae bacterium]
MTTSNAPLMLSVSGLRGIVGHSLTPEVAARFAACFGSFLRERSPGATPTVVLGRDGRAGNAMLHHAALAGLTGAGVNVTDIGVAMTPTVAIATDSLAGKSRGPVAGMVLTASHNPQQWNGMKCLLADNRDTFGSAACAPEAAIAGKIVERFRANTPAFVEWDTIGSVAADTEADAHHVARVLQAIEEVGLSDDAPALGEGLKFAADSVNASGVQGCQQLLEALGVDEFCHLGNQTSGLFPHPPEPTLDNLSAPGGLCDAVKQNGCAAGFAQDPDADRLALIDEKGTYIGEEFTLVLGTLAILESMKRSGEKTQGRTLAANLSTSRMIDDVAAKYGCTVLRTAVGEANVVTAMKKTQSIVGGEGNGGVIWPRVTYVRDSLAAMALTIGLIKMFGKPLSQIVASIPSYSIVKRKVDLSDTAQAKIAADKVAKHFANDRIDLQDGVRVDIESKRAWLHVRGSNTEPIMRLIAEAPTAAVANELLDEASRAIGG